MNSMKNKNPISVKAKSVNKAKVEERLKRKSIGSEIKNGWAIVPAYQNIKDKGIKRLGGNEESRLNVQMEKCGDGR